MPRSCSPGERDRHPLPEPGCRRAGRYINQYLGIPEPEDHTEDHTGDYDRVIMMAHMSVEDTITLSEDEFAMYVMDQWRWKQDFADTTLCYLQ